MNPLTLSLNEVSPSVSLVSSSLLTVNWPIRQVLYLYVFCPLTISLHTGFNSIFGAFISYRQMRSSDDETIAFLKRTQTARGSDRRDIVAMKWYIDLKAIVLNRVIPIYGQSSMALALGTSPSNSPLNIISDFQAALTSYKPIDSP